MSKRKGELSNAAVDRRWPHQVALLDDLCVMNNFEIIRRFCEKRSISPRSPAVTAVWPNRKCETFRLHCFAERADAEAFMAEFGGVLFDPKRDRGKGKMRNAWVRTEEWRRVLESGPLKIPEILAN
jgi:hypothetical protein